MAARVLGSRWNRAARSTPSTWVELKDEPTPDFLQNGFPHVKDELTPDFLQA